MIEAAGPLPSQAWGDGIVIASYLGPGRVFDKAIANFAAAYADQNERSWSKPSRPAGSPAETGL